jgi:hypothetical protein
MTSIFEFVKQSKQLPSSTSSQIQTQNRSSIFDVAKELPEETEPSRARSLISAPIKGYLKGAQSSTIPIFPGGPIPPELSERAFEKILLTQQKAPERFLERGGKLAAYVTGPGKGLPKLIRAGIGTVGAQLAEELGLSEGVQTAIETGSLLTPSSLKGAQKYVSSLYNQAESLAANAKIPAKNLVNQTRSFISNLSRGGPAASKNPAMNQAKSIIDKVKKGQIDVKELTEFKKTINEARGALYSDQALDKNGRKMAKKNLDDISKVVDNALDEYGKINPEWNEIYRSANEAHGAIANSKRVSNFISRTIKQNPHTSGAALAGTLIGHTLSPKTLAVTAGGYGAIKAGEIIARIVKSKTLRKYYTDMIRQASQENVAGFLSKLKKLSENLEKEDKED